MLHCWKLESHLPDLFQQIFWRNSVLDTMWHWNIAVPWGGNALNSKDKDGNISEFSKYCEGDKQRGEKPAWDWMVREGLMPWGDDIDVKTKEVKLSGPFIEGTREIVTFSHIYHSYKWIFHRHLIMFASRWLPGTVSYTIVFSQILPWLLKALY